MPAVCPGCYRRPYGDEKISSVKRCKCTTIFHTRKKNFGLQGCKLVFYGKYVPENAKTGTYCNDMYPNMEILSFFLEQKNQRICSVSAGGTVSHLTVSMLMSPFPPMVNEYCVFESETAKSTTATRKANATAPITLCTMPRTY